MNNLFKKLALTNPGDKFEAYVTPTLKQVVKIAKDDVKISAVRYPSGRIVETRSYVPGSKTAMNLLEKLHN